MLEHTLDCEIFVIFEDANPNFLAFLQLQKLNDILKFFYLN